MANKKPVLKDNKDRFVIFPVKHHDIWDYYKQLLALTDLEDIATKPFASELETPVTEHKKELIQLFLHFWAVRSAVISQNLTEPILQEASIPEVRSVLRLQQFLEDRNIQLFSRIKECLSFSKENYPPRLLKDYSSNSKDQYSKYTTSEKFVALAVLHRMSANEEFFQLIDPFSRMEKEIKSVARQSALVADLAMHLLFNQYEKEVSSERIFTIAQEIHANQLSFLNQAIPPSCSRQLENVRSFLENKLQELIEDFGVAREHTENDPQAAVVEKRANHLQKKSSKASSEARKPGKE